MISVLVVALLNQNLMNKTAKQTLALASIFQSSSLVQQLASTGQCDSHSNKMSLNSIVIDSNSIDEIFTSPEDLQIGFNSLKDVLEKKSIDMHNVMLYVTALINLEKKLMKKPQLLKLITTEIELINRQEFFDINHSNSVARLAELYKNTLGSLSPTIMVRGEQIYLSNQKTANHIRALLLAGIRAVSLWKSQGGKTWHLLLNKKKTLQYIQSLAN